MPVPNEILDNYKVVCLRVDILFTNGIFFLTTISRYLHFTTIEAILNVEAKTLLKSLKGSFSYYHICGFNIQMVMGDNQFDFLINPLAELQIQMTPLAKREHEEFVERNV